MILTDPTTTTRRALLVPINSQSAERAAVETRYAQVWDDALLSLLLQLAVRISRGFQTKDG